jgi:tRNA (guanosine-2'-O-)-methyltransferase
MRRSTPGMLEVSELDAQRATRRFEELARDPAHGAAHVAAWLSPCVTDARRARLRALIDARLDSVSVLLDSPYDPHNGAAVMRSCDAFGVQRLHVLQRHRSFLVAPSVARGSGKWVDVVVHAHAESAIVEAHARGHALVAAHPEGELAPEDLVRLPRLTLVMGSERYGIQPELALACTHRVRVPMRGMVESLNVSVTCALLLYAATAGRTGDLPDDERLRLYARGLYLSVPNAEKILTAAAGGILSPP